MGQPADAGSERDGGVHRLAILDALVAALDRRDEVIDTIAGAEDRTGGRRALARLLGVGETEASAVLEMQLHRFTRRDAARIRSERNDQRRMLGD